MNRQEYRIRYREARKQRGIMIQHIKNEHPNEYNQAMRTQK